MPTLAQLDHAHVWHPFTQMKDWLRREPIVIVSGQGALLRDTRGREYLDANASIWTNLHGHRQPKIDAALQRQLKKIAHSSALGLANEPASLLAARLIEIADCGLRIADSRRKHGHHPQSAIRNPQLKKVFFSDDGSTAMEVALKLVYQFTRRTCGSKTKPRFLSLRGAYHGDTVGAVSLGHIDLFHKAFAALLFKSDEVMAPYCYRCPFNRAKPERADARFTRKCNWECVGKVEQALAKQKKRGEPYAAFVFEPLMQGAAGMIPQPSGWLRQVTELARGHGALLIADEVMTGFGRASGRDESGKAGEREGGKAGKRESGKVGKWASPKDPLSHFQRLNDSTIERFNDSFPTHLFACQSEGVQPDFLCLAKGLTGGYLPMAATLTTQRVFDAFLGEYEEFKSFFHGHSYTGNQLGAAAALASLDLLQGRASVLARARLHRALRDALKGLWSLPIVGDIRQVGLVVGIELVKNWRTREPFAPRERMGARVCEAMAKRGVLTRPVGNVIVLMPPYCMTPGQAERMVEVLRESIADVAKC